jgi:hypothetical protein
MTTTERLDAIKVILARIDDLLARAERTNEQIAAKLARLGAK